MMRTWIGVALLAFSWLLGLDYYLPASPIAWSVVVVLGAVLLSGSMERLPGRREIWPALALLLPAVCYARWPLRAAPLMIVLGLVAELGPIPRRWPKVLGRGVAAAGVVMLVQSLVMGLYAAGTARSHELPWPLPEMFSGIARLLGIDAAADGSNLVMHSIRQVHRLGATWELFADPATLCFFVGSLVMLGLAGWSRLPAGRRWPAWIGALRILTLVVVVWLPIRAGLLMALYLHRVLRWDNQTPPHVMNLFLSPWVHLLMLLGPALLAWRFVGARGQGPGARGQGPGARGQGPGARGQGSGVRGQGPGVRGQGSGVRGQGSEQGAPDLPRSSPQAAHRWPLTLGSSPRGAWHYAAAVGLVLLAAAVFTVAVRWDPVGTRQAGRVMVVERHSTWEPTTKPYDTSWFGEPSGYNYAAAYAYCEQFFEMSRLLESDKIDDEQLSQCDVLVIKIPTTESAKSPPKDPARYSRDEVAAVLRFVEQGGGLLLIGDHTNVFNSGTYLNDIARPMGFTFRHDLLFGTDRSPYEQVYRKPQVPHPVIQYLPPIDFAVSCSIDPGRSRGRAVIVGTGLWSLPSEYHHSNYHPVPQHRPEMRYGAFIQLWSTRHGKGRVLAFTDSTIFSSFCVFQPGKAELLVGMLEWLNHRNEWLNYFKLGDPRPWLVLLGLLPLAAGLWLARTRLEMWPVLLAAGTCGWVIAALAVTAAHRYTMPVPEKVRPMTHLVVDRTLSEVPLSNGAFIRGDGEGYGTFETWIPRMGCYTTRESLPAVGDAERPRPNGQAEFSGDALVVICPSRSVSPQYRERLVQYVAEGGKLLVVDSPENNASTANSLLWPFGLSMHHDRLAGGELILADDWPGIELQRACTVTGGRPIAQVGTASRGTTPVGAMARYQKGTVWAVGFGSLFNDTGMGYLGEEAGRSVWSMQPNANTLFSYGTYFRYNVEFALLRALIEGGPVAEFSLGRIVFDRTASAARLPEPDVPLEEIPQDAGGFGMYELWPLHLGYSTVRARDEKAFSGDALIVIYPGRDAGVLEGFRNRLVQYVAEGGKLLVVDSPENENSTANDLLEPFKLSIDRHKVHTGELLVTLEEGALWPQVPIDPAYRVSGGEAFAHLGRTPIGATIRYKQGAVTAVGFGAQFNNANLRASWDLPPPAKSLVPYDVQTAILRSLLTEQPFSKCVPVVW